MSTAAEMRSEEIRARMRSIRSELPYDMEDAREQIQQLSDWKFYVRRMPIASVACAAAVGFLAVPSPKPSVRQTRLDTEGETIAAKSSLLGGVVGAIASMAFRTGTNIAIRKASSVFLDSHGVGAPRRNHNEDITS
ncbi:hypothetical protein [Rubripirellula reticaptiva]|uniref:DUF3618 domain-containing protein n=1 Tax=Rubripirellula reticaptiva TaxID=2528013 RepID=A0A5C6FDS6_9BACT|nr:hypothetical protein [Rubripirellula reticaptiva]TWU58256.1 hypothetical protein Poly59_11670 [Rubripirellula reticaptiva]